MFLCFGVVCKPYNVYLQVQIQTYKMVAAYFNEPARKKTAATQKNVNTGDYDVKVPGARQF